MSLGETKNSKITLKVLRKNNVSEVLVGPGEEFVDALLDEGVEFPLACCRGVCGLCLFETCGSGVGLLPPDEEESFYLKKMGLDSKYRLACKARVKENTTIKHVDLKSL